MNYFSGCWRTHSILHRIPISDPVFVAANSVMLPNRQLLLQMTLTSQLPVPVTVSNLSLLLSSSAEQAIKPVGFRLPTTLHPEESMSLAFRMDSELVAELQVDETEEANGPQCTLNVSYNIDIFSDPQALTPCESNTSQFTADMTAAQQLPPPPALERERMLHQSLTNGKKGIQQCTFSCSFTLDSLIDRPGPRREKVRATLLPPPTVTAGIPVALTWLLERVGEHGISTKEHTKEQIPFQLLVDASWQALVPRRGFINVPFRGSSTFEAVFLPTRDGDVVAPRLALKGFKVLWEQTVLTVQTS